MNAIFTHWMCRIRSKQLEPDWYRWCWCCSSSRGWSAWIPLFYATSISVSTMAAHASSSTFQWVWTSFMCNHMTTKTYQAGLYSKHAVYGFMIVNTVSIMSGESTVALLVHLSLQSSLEFCMFPLCLFRFPLTCQKHGSRWISYRKLPSGVNLNVPVISFSTVTRIQGYWRWMNKYCLVVICQMTELEK